MSTVYIVLACRVFFFGSPKQNYISAIARSDNHEIEWYPQRVLRNFSTFRRRFWDVDFLRFFRGFNFARSNRVRVYSPKCNMDWCVYIFYLLTLHKLSQFQVIWPVCESVQKKTTTAKYTCLITCWSAQMSTEKQRLQTDINIRTISQFVVQISDRTECISDFCVFAWLVIIIDA